MPGRRNAGTPCIVGSRIANSVCKSTPSSCAHAAAGTLDGAVAGLTGREALLQRVRDFLAGRWTALLAAARDAADQLGPAPTAHSDDDDAASLRRWGAACAHVRRGEVSRGRTLLTAAALAPGTEDTFAALSDPHLPCSPKSSQTCATSNLTRRPHSQTPPSVRLCGPPSAGPLPSAAGLSGATCEHHKAETNSKKKGSARRR